MNRLAQLISALIAIGLVTYAGTGLYAQHALVERVSQDKINTDGVVSQGWTRYQNSYFATFTDQQRQAHEIEFWPLGFTGGSYDLFDYPKTGEPVRIAYSAADPDDAYVVGAAYDGIYFVILAGCPLALLLGFVVIKLVERRERRLSLSTDDSSV